MFQDADEASIKRLAENVSMDRIGRGLREWRRYCLGTGLVGFVVSMAPFVATSAEADRPSYVGVWASSAAACKADPNQTQDIAVRYSETRIDGNEWHCRIGNLRTDAIGWTARLVCSVEGTPSIRRVRWRIAPDGTLRETENGFTETFVHCKNTDFRVGAHR